MNYGYLAYLFLLSLLGHLIGDFLLQPKVWALRKSEPSRMGFGYCTLHVAVYTLAMCTTLNAFSFTAVVSVFIPHWLIDRYSFANVWLSWIKGRTFQAAFNSKDRYREFDVAFTSIVYTVVDSSFHIICLWTVIRLFLPYF